MAQAESSIPHSLTPDIVNGANEAVRVFKQLKSLPVDADPATRDQLNKQLDALQAENRRLAGYVRDTFGTEGDELHRIYTEN